MCPELAGWDSRAVVFRRYVRFQQLTHQQPVQATLTSLPPGLQIQGLITLNSPTYIPQPWHSTLLAIAAASIGCIFNTFFARKLPLIEATMLVLHITGFFAILVTLWVMADIAPSSEVWSGLQNNAGWPTAGLAFVVGITSSVNSLIGPDSAVHMCKFGVGRWFGLRGWS